MIFGGRKATALLIVGDLAVFMASLWLTLLVRYGQVPAEQTLQPYLLPFAFLFALWMLIFAIAGLYGKQAVLFKNELPPAILRTQIFNIVVAALFFFFVPSLGITPKTNLVVYFIVSLVLIFAWRLALFPRLTRPGARERAALVGAGAEADELIAEVNGNKRYPLYLYLIIDPAEVARDFNAFEKKLASEHITMLVVDTDNDMIKPVLARIYDLSLVKRRYRFFDFYRLYEEVFDRVPLSLLRAEWFLKNISQQSFGAYEVTKRVIDFAGGIVMGLVTLAAIPFVFIALQFEGSGPLFIAQERLGYYGARMRAYKFRSMRYNDSASREWVGEGRNHITKVGSVLRRTSLDEFPQFLNILRGELSLIGPRNDIEGLGLRLAEEIPYYQVRYVVRPGITGWAQINQQYEQGNISPQSIEETKVRLAYDFYYIKNRSLAMDLLIFLRTFKRMFFRVAK